MTVEALTDLDVAFGWDGSQSGVADLKSVIQELQGIQFTVVSGRYVAGENITVSGIATTDTLLSVYQMYHDGSADPVRRTLSSQISAANTITVNESIAKASNLYVLWFDKSGR